MYDNHEIQEAKEGVCISNTITVKGILTLFWVHLVAKHVAASSSKEMDNVVEIARKTTS